MAGIAVLAVVWLGPLASSSSHSFSAHMTVHMSVVAIAAPLLSYGLAGRSWDPVRRVPAVFAPLPASLVELAVVWMWHTPALHAIARQNAWGLVAEQSSFLLSGLLLWIAVLGGEAEARAGRGAAGIVALLLTAMHMTLLGALLALSPRALYAHLHGHSGLSALADQHLGGAIMLVVGGASYLAGGLWLSLELLRYPRKASLT
jgi:putative membrane protein